MIKNIIAIPIITALFLILLSANFTFPINNALFNKQLSKLTSKCSEVISYYNQLTPNNFDSQKFNLLLSELSSEINGFKVLIKKAQFDSSEKELENLIKSDYLLKLDMLYNTLKTASTLFQEPISKFTRKQQINWNKRLTNCNKDMNTFIKTHNQVIHQFNQVQKNKEK